MNKLVSSLFNEVTAMLGKDSGQVSTIEDLQKDVESNAKNIEK